MKYKRRTKAQIVNTYIYTKHNKKKSENQLIYATNFLNFIVRLNQTFNFTNVMKVAHVYHKIQLFVIHAWYFKFDTYLLLCPILFLFFSCLRKFVLISFP